MAFNFGSLAEKTNSVARLKPYSINNNVCIKSTDIISGTSANGKSWKRFEVVLGNDEGVFNKSIFYLDVNDAENFKPKEYDMPNGGKRQVPSVWDRTQSELAAIGNAYFPSNFEKLKKGSYKTFDELMQVYKKCCDAVVGKNPTSMKLVGKNVEGKIFAEFPKCYGTAQAKTDKQAADNNCNVGDWYVWPQSPFGDNLTFSPYELSQKNAYENSKPTDMSNVTNLDVKEDNSDLENLDTASLLGELDL